jgi:hypothetical protein
MVSARCLAATIVNLLMFGAAAHGATTEIVVEPRRVAMGESVVVTLRLEGDWTKISDVAMPSRNLELGSASTYSEYSWSNGRASRAKTFRWIAQPLRSGVATVGPLVLRRDGRTIRFEAVDVAVGTDPAASLTAPDDVLEQLESESRDRLFIVATADKTTVFVGEPVLVTWHLYALESLRGIRASESPQLAGFWSEMLEEPAREPEWVMIGARRAQRFVLRKSALFPTRSGTLTIPPLTVSAEIVEPIETPLGRFGSWEGVVKDVKRSSSAIVINARPLPPGVDAVGALTLRVTPPRGGAGGAVSFDVALAGNGNLRAIEAPRFVRAPDARVEIEDRGVTVDRGRDEIVMERRWRYVLFPRRGGALDVPPVALRAFNPRSGAISQLRGGGGQVAAARRLEPPPGAEPPVDRDSGAVNRRIAGATLAGVLAAALAIALLLRRKRVNVGRWVAMHDDPARLRAELDLELAARGLDPSALLREESERGDAWRSVVSWIELRGKHRDEFSDPRDLRRRVQELLRAIR